MHVRHHLDLVRQGLVDDIEGVSPVRLGQLEVAETVERIPS